MKTTLWRMVSVLPLVMLGMVVPSSSAAETVYERAQESGAIELTNVPSAEDYEVAVTGPGAGPGTAGAPGAPPSRFPLATERRGSHDSAVSAVSQSQPSGDNAGAAEHAGATAADQSSTAGTDQAGVPASGGASVLQSLYDARRSINTSPR